MIAHHIKRAGGSFERLGCYILDIAHRADQRAFDRLAGYVVDRIGDGERVVAARVSNCADDDIEMAITEIELVQAQNTRSQSGKSYHLVVSFREGERPTAEQLRDIEDNLVASIGLSDHQRISAVHDDTDNLHMHIAINKVHPTNFRNVDPHRDYPKLMAACRELELKHNLQLDNHGLASDQIRNLGQDAASTRKSDRAIKMETHSGRQSLAGWIEANAKADILSAVAHAPSWEALHKALGQHGLTIRPRGAGLSIGVPETKAWVKASSVDRSMSATRLTDRLGPYTGPIHGYTSPRQRYGEAQGRDLQKRRLHAAYTIERAAKMSARAAALSKVNQAYRDYAVQLRDHYRREKDRVRIQPGLSGRSRREAVGQIEHLRKKACLERDRLRDQAMADAKAAHPLPTWQGFLEYRASVGEEAALSALRSRKAHNGGHRAGRSERVPTELIVRETCGG
ncbi:TraI/MobA(P) family conjugative relaxase [Brevundimonas sp.]|uniref:TraI/MobA(P) family conjugative relaxase n=1 Tax=Brevundimonas sp. TaxID=1871086 RepID=UPI003AFFE0E2